MANNFKGYETNGITTETVVYTGPANTQTTIIGMTLANTTGNATLASVIKNNTYLVKDAPIPSGGSLVIVGGDQKVVIEPNDIVKVSADNAVDVIISTLEIV